MAEQLNTQAAVALLVGPVVAFACGFAAACGGGDKPDAGGFNPDAMLEAAQAMGDADPACRGAADGVLRVGSLLPVSPTGDLAILGPPMRAAALLPTADVNSAGGVNGQPLDYIEGDETPPNAGATVQSHLQANVDVVLGAASTAVSEQQLPTLVDACRVMFSPANTGPRFTTHADDDLYFRTAPSDMLQGRVLADLAREDGVATAAIVAREDPWGQGLTYFIRRPFEADGGRVVVQQFYGTRADSFGTEVGKVVEADPDALFLIGYDESGGLLQELLAAGFSPATKKIYLVDGNMRNDVGARFSQPNALLGVRGSFPSAPVPPDFLARLQAQDPMLVDFVYGPETYDAVVITALAAVAAGTDQPDEVARHINAVTRSGTGCTAFAQCRDLLVAGIDIDYNGPSGPQEFCQAGEPTTATIAVVAFGANNQIDPASVVYRSVSMT